MSRIRYNAASGFMPPAGSISATATTYQFASAPPFATITGGDYVPLTLSPGAANEEVVWLTAYTAGQTTGTISRAQEGFAAAAHVARDAAPNPDWLVGPTVWDFGAKDFQDVGGQVFNIKHPAYGAKGDGVTDDTAAIQAAINAAAAIGGIVLLPPSATSYVVNTGPLTIPNGVKFWGYGATITATVAGVSYFFRQVVASGGSIHDVEFRGIAFTGGSSASTVQAIVVDNSASNTTANYNVKVVDCTFTNCYAGVIHWANNAFSGIRTFNMHTRDCRFDNCVYGYAFQGSYGDWIDHCDFILRSASLVAIYTPDMSGVLGTSAGTLAAPSGIANATICKMTEIEVEGMVQNYSTGSDNGIVVSVSNSTLHDVHVQSVSQVGLNVHTAETGLNNELSDIRLWGNGSGIVLDATTADQVTGGSVTGLHVEDCAQKTNWSSWAYRAYPIYINAGAWDIGHGAVVLGSEMNLTGTVTPAYGVGVGFGGRSTIVDVRFPTFGTGLLNPAAGHLPKFFACPGVNPAGTRTVAVPATGVAVAADYMDRTFYVTAAAGGCTMAIQGGPSVVIPATALGTVRVPAGQTVTPTFTNAPTWVVEGE